MGRTLIAVAALALLAACGGKPAADPPPTHSPTPTVSGSPTPTPPVMPAAATEHTEAGAKAWFEYFWSVLDYATATYDTEQLAQLMSSGCVGCNAGLKAIRDDQEAHATITGGSESAANVSVKTYTVRGQLEAVVSGDITNTAQVISYPSPRAAQTFDAGTHHVALALRPTASGWWITEWNPGQ